MFLLAGVDTHFYRANIKLFGARQQVLMTTIIPSLLHVNSRDIFNILHTARFLRDCTNHFCIVMQILLPQT
jgi:hypothetical protein